MHHEPMDITKMLVELKAEREGVEQAILVTAACPGLVTSFGQHSSLSVTGY
jgi:hypothetical protein